MMLNSRSIYAQFLLNFCPTKKPAPKMGQVSTGRMWYFIATLFSPREKAAPTGTLQKTGGGFCFVMLYT
jgi:hypothetical protein